MATHTSTIDATAEAPNRGLAVTAWIGQVAVAAILGMGAFGKFFMYTPEGSQALAQALGVGRGVITMIGAIEMVAVILILTPRFYVYGAALAAMTMLGALFSHATKIGWSGSATAEMWPLALVALVAAVFVLWARRSELRPGQ